MKIDEKASATTATDIDAITAVGLGGTWLAIDAAENSTPRPAY
jgi:hypothetical protein